MSLGRPFGMNERRMKLDWARGEEHNSNASDGRVSVDLLIQHEEVTMGESTRTGIASESSWGSFMDEFEGDSDRAAAILGFALIDDILTGYLSSFLVDNPVKVKKLIGTHGPLSSFWSRSLAAYCMGLISADEYHDLDLMRKIRNEFAHDLRSVSFSSDSVRGKCSRFRLGEPTHQVFSELGVSVPADRPMARYEFSVAVGKLVMALHMRRKGLRRREVAKELRDEDSRGDQDGA